MPIGKEDQLQIAVCNFAKVHKLPFDHYANERKCSVQYGRLLKRKGVRSGVLDCHFSKPNNKFRSLWIELKIKPNKPTDNQLAFAEEKISQGDAVFFCYSLDEAILVISEFYSLKTN